MEISSKPFQCPLCGRTFLKRSNAKKHLSTHRVWPPEIAKTLIPHDNPKGYLCPFCPFVSTTHPKHRSHLTIHQDLKYYVCIQPNCTYISTNLDYLVDHVTITHPQQQYTCQLCEKLTFSLDEISDHYTLHDFENSNIKTIPKYQCSICKSIFSNDKNLQHHLATVSHDHVCQQCAKTFPCERTLRRHLQLHAPEEFKCEVCSKGFRTAAYLKTHSLTHKEATFVCEICAVKFNRKDRLKRHLKIHTSGDLFKCPLFEVIGCTKAFSRSDKLKMHLNTHTKRLIQDVENAELAENREEQFQKMDVMVLPFD